MSKTINLRKALQADLKQVIENVYYEDVPDTTTYPYIVYVLDRIQENYQLEMNIYDKSDSTLTVESIVDSVESLFERYICSDETQVFTTYLNARNSISEEDKSIKRRRLLFNINYFGME